MTEQVVQYRAQVMQLQDELGHIRQKLNGSEVGWTEAHAPGDQQQAHRDKALARPVRTMAAKKSK